MIVPSFVFSPGTSTKDGKNVPSDRPKPAPVAEAPALSKISCIIFEIDKSVIKSFLANVGSKPSTNGSRLRKYAVNAVSISDLTLNSWSGPTSKFLISTNIDVRIIDLTNNVESVKPNGCLAIPVSGSVVMKSLASSNNDAGARPSGSIDVSASIKTVLLGGGADIRSIGLPEYGNALL